MGSSGRAGHPAEQRTPDPLTARWRAFLDELRGRRQFARRKVLVDRYQIVDGGTPSLKIIGRTWVDRGPSYWARRCAWSLVWLALTLVLVLTAGMGVVQLTTSPLPLVGSIPIALLWWLPAIPGFVYPWRRLAVFPFGERPAYPFVFPGPLLAPLVLVFLPALAALCTAICLSTLRRNFPGEAAAREAYDESHRGMRR